jgi:hypothetical protein
MLRNNEIMIGNWFIVGRGTDWEKNVQVDEIFDNSVGLRGREFTTYMLSLEPIPINSVFIEKNGFIKDTLIDSRDCGYSIYNKLSGDFHVQVLHWDDSDEWDVHIDDSHYMSLGDCITKYVHQMQNFLNILGVDSTFIV